MPGPICSPDSPLGCGSPGGCSLPAIPPKLLSNPGLSISGFPGYTEIPPRTALCSLLFPVPPAQMGNFLLPRLALLFSKRQTGLAPRALFPAASVTAGLPWDLSCGVPAPLGCSQDLSSGSSFNFILIFDLPLAPLFPYLLQLRLTTGLLWANFGSLFLLHPALSSRG